MLFMNKNKYEEEIIFNNKGIHINKFDANTFKNKGNILHEQRKFKYAVKAYDIVIKLNPLDCITYNNKGNGLYELKEFKEAEQAYNFSVKLNNKDENNYKIKGDKSSEGNKNFEISKLNNYN